MPGPESWSNPGVRSGNHNIHSKHHSPFPIQVSIHYKAAACLRKAFIRPDATSEPLVNRVNLVSRSQCLYPCKLEFLFWTVWNLGNRGMVSCLTHKQWVTRCFVPNRSKSFLLESYLHTPLPFLISELLQSSCHQCLQLHLVCTFPTQRTVTPPPGQSGLN